MNHEPRVTIGLPVFNAEKYLACAIGSILAQTYSDFRLIISDNASSDRTPEICRDFAAQDSRIRYVCNAKNLGAAPNFNRVFELSSSEYFKWAPYDDMIAPTFLSVCVRELDAHPEAVLCFSKAKIIDDTGAYIDDYDPGPDTSSAKPAIRFRNLILHPEYAIQQMGLIRGQVLKETALHGSFPSSDEVLLAELALLGAFQEIPERLYLYRRHQEQSTREGEQRRRMGFFDTSLANRITLPKWLYFNACLCAIRRSARTKQDKAACYLTVLRWLLVPAHYRAMGKDIFLATRLMISHYPLLGDLAGGATR